MKKTNIDPTEIFEVTSADQYCLSIRQDGFYTGDIIGIYDDIEEAKRTQDVIMKYVLPGVRTEIHRTGE